MKLATATTAEGHRLLLAGDDGLVDVDAAARALDEPAAAGLADVRAALDRDGGLDAVRRVAARLGEAGVDPLDAASVTLAPPVVAPSKMICVGLNYALHAAEGGMALPERPILFAKFPSALVGDGARVRKHAVTDKLDYEGELAFVIGRTASGVDRAEALDHVAGYTIMNDVSARDLQRAEAQWIRAKSLDTFAPLGPALVTADEVPDPARLRIRTLVNGELRQDEGCADMVFGVPELVEFISEAITLEPGDVVATGTPSGVGFGFDPPRYLEPGDSVEITIEPIGTLRSSVE
jgi:2-keto-4-pentenoate hydratase/2-oxohepta-3-ene-1,7-dioic acid hydratase in catechol pathway